MSHRRIHFRTLAALCALAAGSFAFAQKEKPEKPDKPERAERVKDKESKKSSKTSATSTKSSATPEAPREPGSYDAFRVIADRNIFNPNRTRARGPEEVAPKVDTIALVGIVHDSGKVVAVFDSPDEGFRKALQVGENIADFSVTKIEDDHIELSGKDGKAFPFRMSQQLRRVEGGEWRTTGRDFVRIESSRDRPSKDTPAIPSDASAVLRRLMEQRQKQLKQ
ncbi:MAG TPA: hypothetical protein VGE76_13925 [Opitutaceae bacterium]